MQGRDDGTSDGYRIASYASWTLAAVTIVTFGFALAAIPISGSNCQSNCIEYPYLDTLDRFPRDYLWMFFGILLLITYVAFVVALRSVSQNRESVAGASAVALGAVAAAVLVPTYFIQATVVPASLAAGQTEGISLLTQYNPHGLFIAAEEIGYLVMSASFLLLVPLVTWHNVMSRIVRWVFVAGFVLPIVAFGAIATVYGFDRQDRFEVIIISIDWLVLIINGILLALIFQRRRKADTRT